MKKTLLDKGIISQNGEICKPKINLVAGAITKPLAEMVCYAKKQGKNIINLANKEE